MLIVPALVRIVDGIRYATALDLTREAGEAAVKDESALFFRLRNVLRKEGFDVIKKEMSKDGHMVSDGVYYVRTRDQSDKSGSFMIWDRDYAVRNAALDFNRHGMVMLSILGNFPVPPRTVLDWRPEK